MTRGGEEEEETLLPPSVGGAAAGCRRLIDHADYLKIWSDANRQSTSASQRHLRLALQFFRGSTPATVWEFREETWLMDFSTAARVAAVPGSLNMWTKASSSSFFELFDLLQSRVHTTRCQWFYGFPRHFLFYPKSTKQDWNFVTFKAHAFPCSCFI